MEAMDALFGVVPHDHEALQQGRMGAALNLNKVYDDTNSTGEKAQTRSHVEAV